MPGFSFVLNEEEFSSFLKARHRLEQVLGRRISWRETIVLLSDAYLVGMK